MKKVKVGIIGCGVISGIYLENITKTFDILDLKGVADIDMEKAELRANQYQCHAMTVDKILLDDEIEIILNLTIPKAHYEVAKKVLMAGKNVYNEKPLTLTREEGKELLKISKEKNLRISSAPDTFLGAGIQTCRKIIEDGQIGDIVGASAFMMSSGVESWHPSPEFYYKVGGGPMFDMGPYYLTALINLIGPVKSVSGYAKTTYDKRLITSEPLNGKIIDVDVPTHITGILEFQNGAIGNIITSFDVWGSNLPRIEVYGTKGTISVPDPNGFGGPVMLKMKDDNEFKHVGLKFGYSQNSRGIGVADMAYAIRNNRKHRANGNVAYHVIDIMHAIHDASNERRFIDIESTCEKPEILKVKNVLL